MVFRFICSAQYATAVARASTRSSWKNEPDLFSKDVYRHFTVAGST
jgi:hypothetical protein